VKSEVNGETVTYGRRGTKSFVGFGETRGADEKKREKGRREERKRSLFGQKSVNVDIARLGRVNHREANVFASVYRSL
jgi:hypothetical protein